MCNYAKIKNWDVANGEGLGVSVYFSGCDKEPKCKGCFNSEIWDYDVGQPFTKDTTYEVLDMVKNPHINHLSILGGEPLAAKNISKVSYLCQKVKTYYADKKVWLWTHYKWEDLIKEPFILHYVLPYVDVLVDGEYIESKRDLRLKWRGSYNQRVIDVPLSLKHKVVVSHRS
jgi:anaerobic ribonucleoside-triphosphate reductase activating protein